MSKSAEKMQPPDRHAGDIDDVWAWIVIGLIVGGVTLGLWLPVLISLGSRA